MKTFLLRIFYRIVPCYKRVAYCVLTWPEAEELLRSESGWSVAPEDIASGSFYRVHLEKRERVFVKETVEVKTGAVVRSQPGAV